MTWTPNIETRNAIWEFMQYLLSRLPYRLGIDEILPGCELIDLDPYSTGGAIPRYVKVRINRYAQDAWYNGNVGLVLGEYYTVIHMRAGDRYEVSGPSGIGGGGGGSYVAPAAGFERILVDCVTGEVVIDCVAGEVVIT